MIRAIRIKKGLDLPISGEPEQQIEKGPRVKHVALLGRDYTGLKPKMLVAVGDRVKLGQPLFSDKQAGIHFTSPGCGSVVQINRGAKRFLESIVVRLDGDEAETFPAYDRNRLNTLSSGEVEKTLLASGQWVALRTRPFSRIPAPNTRPHSLFVTAVDTNPLAPSPATIIQADQEAFVDGLAVLSRLIDTPIFVCTARQADIPVPSIDGISIAQFEGPHPAGLPGTHIHFLDPVGAQKTVWHIGFQDVIAIGLLFTTGRLQTERVISLAGPMVKRPRLLRTRLGADTHDLINDETQRGNCRIISGSVFSGRHAAGPESFLGRYHNQISVIGEGGEREFLGWMAPGLKKFSVINVLASSFFRKRRFDLNSSQNGSPRAMVPIDNFEKVMPLDILPTPLLKALLVRDTETAQALGCLELDEEDLALCSFVCCSKYDYGRALRESLGQIERGE